MYHDMNQDLADLRALSQMGTDAFAYMRRITSEEISQKFPEIEEIESGRTYWAMFAADGTPLMLSDEQTALTHSAYFNNLTATLPN